MTDWDKHYITRKCDYTQGTMLPTDITRMVPDELINDLSPLEWIGYVVGTALGAMVIVSLVFWFMEH